MVDLDGIEPKREFGGSAFDLLLESKPPLMERLAELAPTPFANIIVVLGSG